MHIYIYILCIRTYPRTCALLSSITYIYVHTALQWGVSTHFELRQCIITQHERSSHFTSVVFVHCPSTSRRPNTRVRRGPKHGRLLFTHFHEILFVPFPYRTTTAPRYLYYTQSHKHIVLSRSSRPSAFLPLLFFSLSSFLTDGAARQHPYRRKIPPDPGTK